MGKAFAIGLCLLASAASGADRVSVSVLSGRSFKGFVDQRSNARQLWIRSGKSGLTIRRPIEWRRIKSLRVNGRPSSAKAILDVLREAKSTVPLPPSPVNGISSQPAKGETKKEPAAAGVVQAAARATHLFVDVEVGNWDRDAENDGLVVRFYPLDQRAMPVPTHGTLQLTLRGSRRAKFHESPRGARLPIIIGRWSVPVSANDAGKPIHLPFGALHPERDRRIASYGDIDAALAAPGHGVLRARQFFLRLRPFPFTR